ncbi:MAG: NAD(P)H-hydrate dehydratase [Lachnospiraceae bacterium]|nr:NAD(P)H-hydrate dehydratase [Lachnospiraceae bacterium]
MKYIVKSREMKAYDEDTINRIGIPSVVLMERAALAVVEELVKSEYHHKRVLIVAGCGNNGGDGLAIGRLLALRGYDVTFCLVGSPEKMTDEAKRQMNIIQNLGFSIQSKLKNQEYDMVIDALLGIGLSRDVSGEYLEWIQQINLYRSRGACVYSVDIPSGICADNGKVMGDAVHADFTVTFGFAKRGHLFYPGKEYTGKLVVSDIGITEKSFEIGEPSAFCYERKDLSWLIPYRRPDGNKGTFGKVLLVAGSRDMSGACVLCGNSILRSGAGMVKMISDICNREILQQTLPEAMLYSYEEKPDEKRVRDSLSWCDVVVVGPGIGTGENAYAIMKLLLENQKLPMIIDADGLNLISEHEELENLAAMREKGKTIMTPHPGELVRLMHTSMEEYKKNREKLAGDLAEKFGCVVVAKDAVTLVVQCNQNKLYINTSGNDAMATAGSGDVLAGIIGGLTAQGMHPFEAACIGVYLHGIAGENASVKNGKYGVTSSDIIKELMTVMGGVGGTI